MCQDFTLNLNFDSALGKIISEEPLIFQSIPRTNLLYDLEYSEQVIWTFGKILPNVSFCVTWEK